MKKYNFIKEVIIRHSELVDTSHRLSSEITQFYQRHYGEPHLIVITILNGGWDFSRSIFSSGYFLNKFQVTTYTINAKSHYGSDKSLNWVAIEMGSAEREEEIKKAVEGHPVLIVDDIHDTGRTLREVVSKFAGYSPASIECCVMIERNCKHVSDLKPRFVGFKVDTQEFLVGAGLDFKGGFRDLPYIGTLKADFEGEPVEEHICNKCGELCISPEEREVIGDKAKRVSNYGLIDAIARGGYFSPILEDCTAYLFDLCEPCLKKLFDGFKLPVDEREYMVWDGKIL